MTLLVGLVGLLLAAGPPLAGAVLAYQGSLTDYPWLIALVWIAALSVMAGIGIVVLGLLRARAAEIERLERERRQLRDSEDRFRSLVLNTTDVIITVTAAGAIEYHCPSAGRIWGYAPDDLNHANVLEIVHEDDQAIAQSLFEEALARPRLGIAAELRICLADNSWRHFDVVATNLLRDPRVGGIVVTFRDITERKEFEQTLTYQASHDALTDLPNRTLFRESVERTLHRAIRQESPIAVMFIDVDNFKVVNDSLGHPVGDQLLIQTIADALETSGLDPRCLKLELTESVMIGDVGLVRERLAELKKLAIQIAIDDFGTGFSSLAYLRDLPISFVKIDRSFIARLGMDRRDNAIVRSIVGLSHDLDLTVIGEGIELVEQLATLRDLGCDFGQGFFFSAGVPADVAGELLRTGLMTPRKQPVVPVLARNERHPAA